MPDVDRPGIARPHELVAQAQLPGKQDGRRARGQERVRTLLDGETLEALCPDLAAQALARLGKDHRHAVTGQGPRGRQTGDAAADDENGHRTTDGQAVAPGAAGAATARGMP